MHIKRVGVALMAAAMIGTGVFPGFLHPDWAVFSAVL